MIYKIMSFNVQNLSLGAEKEKLDLISKIIRDNKIDIVAMQEVLGEGKILTGINLKSVSGAAKAYEHSLKNRLGKNWDMSWRNPETKAKDYFYLGKDNRGEGYAFLWNTDRVDLLEEDNRIKYPRIYRDYKANRDLNQIRLIRDPCYGQFKIGRRNGSNGRPVEIRLITTHIVYGKPATENINADLDFGAVTMRRNEFRILAGQIYPKIDEDYKQKSCTSHYTVLLGDYNLNLGSSGVGKAILPDIMCFDDKGREMSYNFSAPTVINTVQSGLSTIGRDGDTLASNYDHFSFGNKVASRIPELGIAVINPSDYIDGEDNVYKMYKKKVSDHLPIILTLDI